MTELSDYKRFVEKPNDAAMQRKINGLYARVDLLLKTGEEFRMAVIRSGALNHVSQDKYMDQLRAFEGALAQR